MLVSAEGFPFAAEVVDHLKQIHPVADCAVTLRHLYLCFLLITPIAVYSRQLVTSRYSSLKH